MLRGTVRTLRYARAWKSRAGATATETVIDREGLAVSATLFCPPHRRGRLPAWIALGGVSRMGRRHPQLVRFAEALAATPAAVLVPEIPEWRRLDVTPRVALPTIRAALDLLRKRPEVHPGKVGLIGFSFGAPQVAIAACEDDVAERVAGITLFGGYCCLERTVRCQLTGDHEWDGTDYELSPDPYGRWVMGSRHLTDVEGFEDASDVATALGRLAAAASEKRIAAWDPHHDEMIGQLRAALPARRHALFDLFATPAGGRRPARAECAAMAGRLARASLRVEPLLAPAAHLGRLGVPTRFFHGRGDRLIPFTESLRLSRSLKPGSQRGLTVTALFNHSADHCPARPLERLRENVTFFGALRGLVDTV